MKLLNVKTLQIEEFLENRLPAYAVLSHTWGQDEVSFRDIRRIKVAKKRAGFAKIAYTCTQAQEDGLAYAWVDTCCIDKSSSAELQEAINSMYRWYAKADICYAYLADFRWTSFTSPNTPDETLGSSAWFGRGWTLQELIAPKEVKFYDVTWTAVGRRSTTLGVLKSITKIDASVLNHTRALSSVSIAKRMSWAAYRQTSRPEDIAYCLLGIFEVNIPMLYGEGSRSFIRLQEEILRTSNDHSLLAWGIKAARKTGTLLAESPTDFAECHEIACWGRPGEYELTNRGMRVRLPILRSEHRFPEPQSSQYDRAEYLGILNCRFEDDLSDSTLALRLQKDLEHGVFNIYSGVDVASSMPGCSRLAYIKSDRIPPEPPEIVEVTRVPERSEVPIKFTFQIHPDASYNHESPVVAEEYYPITSWNAKRNVMRPSFDSLGVRSLDRGSSTFLYRDGHRGAALLHSWRSGRHFAIAFGIDIVARANLEECEGALDQKVRLIPVIGISVTGEGRPYVRQADESKVETNTLPEESRKPSTGTEHDSLVHACSRLQRCEHRYGRCPHQSQSGCRDTPSIARHSWAVDSGVEEIVASIWQNKVMGEFVLAVEVHLSCRFEMQ